MTVFNYTPAHGAAQKLTPVPESFKPIGDRVLVRRIADLAEFVSSLYVPECAQKLSVRGVVVAVGLGKRDADGFRRPLDVKVGDVIEFGRFTDFDDGDLVLIQEADIVGVITNDEKCVSPDSAQATTAAGQTKT